jgi:hypothetical protein
MVVNNQIKPSKNMYMGTNEITNKGLGFQLTNSTSFGESVIYAGVGVRNGGPSTNE